MSSAPPTSPGRRPTSVRFSLPPPPRNASENAQQIYSTIILHASPAAAQAPDPLLETPKLQLKSILKVDVESEKVKAIQALQLEEDWESDPENARNWSSGRKWSTVVILLVYSIVPLLGMSMMAPGLRHVAQQYHTGNNQITKALSLSIYPLAFAFGTLVFAPLSEIHGRKWILHFSNAFAGIFTLVCTWVSQNVRWFTAFRFLAGLAGSGSFAVGNGVIGDCFSEQNGASVKALWAVAPLLGPVIGPIFGGFIIQNAGFKYVFIVLACCFCLSSFVGIALLHETYAPLLRVHRSRGSGDLQVIVRILHMPAHLHGGKWRFMWTRMTRPLVLFARSFSCFILSLHIAFSYGIIFIIFVVSPDVYHAVWDFGPSAGGLTYLGLAFGIVFAWILNPTYSDYLYKYLATKNGGVARPEMRMYAVSFGSFFSSVGLFVYGWCMQANSNWGFPIVGTVVFGAGLSYSFLATLQYFVEEMGESASGASVILCFFFAFVSPLFGEKMIISLGPGRAISVLASLVIALGVPFPMWIYYRRRLHPQQQGNSR